jgi:hypothetical protein
MLRRKEWEHDCCPRCETPNKDSDHILLCPAPSARQQWQLSLEALDLKLEEYRTHPDIRRVVMAKLRAWPHTDTLSFSGSGITQTVLDAMSYQEFSSRKGNRLLARCTRRMDCTNVHQMATQFHQMAQPYYPSHLGSVLGHVDAAQCCVP